MCEKLDSEKLINPFPPADSYIAGCAIRGLRAADNLGARRWAAAFENYEYGRHL